MKTRFRFTWFLLVIVLGVEVKAQQGVELSLDKVKKIEAIVSAEILKQKIPGFSIAVVMNRQLGWSNGYGLADVKSSSPARATTVYRLASTSKPITATGVLQLVERGKIDLDAPIHKYCPAFPETKWPVTVRQLLGHLGGIRHYQSDEEFNSTRHYNSIVESLDIFKNDPLKHEPGTKYLYSTFGYSLLGCAIEGASGMSFIEYLRENIFKPAGMNHTALDDVRAAIPNRAEGYAKNKSGELIAGTPADTSSKIPGGGLVGTVEDLARFAVALQADRLLKKETLNQMWTRQKTSDARETTYGMGWGVNDRNGQKEVIHGGTQQGVTTYLYMLPERGFAVVMMMNLEEAERRREIARQIADIALL